MVGDVSAKKRPAAPADPPSLNMMNVSPATAALGPNFAAIWVSRAAIARFSFAAWTAMVSAATDRVACPVDASTVPGRAVAYVMFPLFGGGEQSLREDVDAILLYRQPTAWYNHRRHQGGRARAKKLKSGTGTATARNPALALLVIDVSRTPGVPP